MRKYQCNACEIRICTAEYQDGSGIPFKCTSIIDMYHKPQWKEIEPTQETVTDCNQLPDWCKPGEWCYCKDDDGNDKYFKIVSCDNHFIYGDDGWNIAVLCAKPARLRTYNADEMRGLVGKVIEWNGDAFLVTAFSKERNLVVFDSIHHLAGDLINNGYTIDGKPCGVLEHLEKGKWIK